jgi:cation:H+ antiporter
MRKRCGKEPERAVFFTDSRACIDHKKRGYLNRLSGQDRPAVRRFVLCRGYTVIAFGTSAPELAVGIISGFSKANELTLGNIIGSSLSNIAFIIGLAALLTPLRVRDSIVRRELPMLFAIQLLMCLMLIFDQRVSRPDALILLFCFAAFMVYVTRGAKQSMAIRIDAEGDIDTDLAGNGIPAALAGELSPSEKNDSLLKLWLLSLLSLAGLFIGGRLTVSSSVNIAESLGLDQTLIGLTVVSLATTMPELITSIVAVRKKEPDIVLGNCIGSILFNIMLVLGASALIHPITVEADIRFDLTAMMAVTVILLTISAFSKKLSRPAGLLILFLFIGYLTVKGMTALGT